MDSTQQTPLVTRIRQNHALEHATIHVLTYRDPSVRLVGRSDWGGFTLYGNVDTRTVMDCVCEALDRLRNHESWLATHPNCGTNLAVGAALAGAAAMGAAAMPYKSWLGRVLGVTAALATSLVIAGPLGEAMQQYVTTTPEARGLCVRTVRREAVGNLVVHRVLTADSIV